MKDYKKLPPPKSITEVKHLKSTTTSQPTVDTTMSGHKKLLAKSICDHVQSCPVTYNQLIIATEDTTKIIRLLSDALARNSMLYRQIALSHLTIEVSQY